MFTRNLALAAVLVLLAACAHLSVIHLDKRPWILGQEDRLAMRYWNFSYTSRLEGNNIITCPVMSESCPETRKSPSPGGENAASSPPRV